MRTAIATCHARSEWRPAAGLMNGLKTGASASSLFADLACNL
jgi:hypothetical protein